MPPALRRISHFAGWPEPGPGVHFMTRVLVIDDQADVRAMIGIVLRINRFEVVEAGTAAAGISAFEQSCFDLAIVDVFLQGSSGVDLIVKMRERVPDLPIIAISGMTALDFVAESPELSDVVCLQKPFRPNDLLAAINTVRGKHVADGAAVA
jgi:DNA-binding response OmpR family regulator